MPVRKEYVCVDQTMSAMVYQIPAFMVIVNVALTQHVLEKHRIVVAVENVCVEQRMNARGYLISVYMVVVNVALTHHVL